MLLFLAEWLDKRTIRLMNSLRQAEIPFCSTVIQYEGFGSSEHWNPFIYYTGFRGYSGRGRYFNEIHVPPLDEIRHISASHAHILRGDTTVGVIHYYPEMNRLVKQVDWLNKQGKKIVSDCYSLEGFHYCKITFNEQGQEETKTWINSQGEACIWQDAKKQHILLKKENTLSFFSNLTEFVTFFLEELIKEKKLPQFDRCVINHLGTPLFTAKRLSQFPTTIFWQETSVNGLPGNMKMEIENPTAIDTIIFEEQAELDLAKQTYPDKEKRKAGFYYLSPLEQFTRGSRFRKRALTLTYSDNIHQVDMIVKMLPDVQWTIAAPTDVSNKLRSLENKYDQITVLDWVTKEKVEELLETHDIYFDLNDGREVNDCVYKAYLNQHLIFTLEKTKKNPRYECVLNEGGATVERTKKKISDESCWRDSLKELHEKNGPRSYKEDYQALLDRSKIQI